jgi:hypothetical protein
MPAPSPSASLPGRLALAAALTLAVAACGGDDAPAGPDAAAGVCNLPPEPIACTEGDDSPCTAVCDVSYCHLFGTLGQNVCTRACTDVGDCPTGWSCNMMGRCRPPDP